MIYWFIKRVSGWADERVSGFTLCLDEFKITQRSLNNKMIYEISEQSTVFHLNPSTPVIHGTDSIVASPLTVKCMPHRLEGNHLERIGKMDGGAHTRTKRSCFYCKPTDMWIACRQSDRMFQISVQLHGKWQVTMLENCYTGPLTDFLDIHC